MPIDQAKPPQSLKMIAMKRVMDPSRVIKILHSKHLNDVQRGANAPAAAIGKAASKVGGAAVSLACAIIPVPYISSVVKPAYEALVQKIRSKVRKYNKGDEPGSDEWVKFSLKEVGEQVESWDRYRWKITHAMEVFNKTVQEFEQTEKPMCREWVNVLETKQYLAKRIRVFDESMMAMEELINQTRSWMDRVEQAIATSDGELERKYQHAFHHTMKHEPHYCSDDCCMFSTKDISFKSKDPTTPAGHFSAGFEEKAA